MPQILLILQSVEAENGHRGFKVSFFLSFLKLLNKEFKWKAENVWHILLLTS